MAYPYIFHSNFEAAFSGEWDVAESDTGSKLDRVHYLTLASDYQAGRAPMPFRGAYCMRIDLASGDTNDHTVADGDMNIADGSTGYFRWYMWVSNNFTATADDTFSIFELQQDGGTVEMTVGMRVTAASGLVEIGIGDGVAPTSLVPMPLGKWVCVEILATVSTTDAGVLTLFLDGQQMATLTSLDHAAAVGLGVLGTQLTLSTTTGQIYFDHFTMDDARLYPLVERFPMTLPVIKTGHLFVGPGTIDSAVILSANGTLDLYDSDVANSNDAFSRLVELDTANYSTFEGPIAFKRGCYAVVAGTNPRCEVKLNSAGKGPMAYGGEGAIRNWASKRIPHPLGV